MIKLYELTYKDYKASDQPLKEKINGNISEINRKLMEVEQLINHANKLKTETSSDQRVFYKNTFKRFNSVNERLNRIGHKIKELLS